MMYLSHLVRGEFQQIWFFGLKPMQELILQPMVLILLIGSSQSGNGNDAYDVGNAPTYEQILKSYRSSDRF
ncbi:MAG: hypothetical protein U5L96_08045 [Owenweeksia sp.]|nr:hypothetical protein [Owenweeksia sp.]